MKPVKTIIYTKVNMEDQMSLCVVRVAQGGGGSLAQFTNGISERPQIAGIKILLSQIMKIYK